MKKRDQEILDLCKAVAEMSMRCDDDLCGDHRAFYNPRLAKATTMLTKLYPGHMVAALMEHEESL